MKIYKTQEEIEADIKDGALTVEGDVKFEVSFSIMASLKIAGDIDARDINARDIIAWDINAGNINARDINARDINARDINAWDINARDIDARDINAGDIDAWDINARDISFYAVCFAYMKFVCKSVIGRRDNSKFFCLDSDVKTGVEKAAKKK